MTADFLAQRRPDWDLVCDWLNDHRIFYAAQSTEDEQWHAVRSDQLRDLVHRARTSETAATDPQLVDQVADAIEWARVTGLGSQSTRDTAERIIATVREHDTTGGTA